MSKKKAYRITAYFSGVRHPHPSEKPVLGYAGESCTSVIIRTKNINKIRKKIEKAYEKATGNSADFMPLAIDEID